MGYRRNAVDDNQLEITIKGKPFSQKRHRTSRSGHRYDPSKKDKETIRQLLLPIKPSKPLEGKFRVHVIAYFPTPKSWSNTRIDEVEECYRAKTPDTDNIAKILYDAMNDYILADDRYIVDSRVEKCYSVHPRTEISIETL